jgi:kynurenine formamidase
MIVGRAGIIGDAESSFKPVSIAKKVTGPLPFIGDPATNVFFEPKQKGDGWVGVRCHHTKASPSPHLIGTHIESASHVSGFGKVIGAVLQDNPIFSQPLRAFHAQVVAENVPIQRIEVANGETTFCFSSGDTYKLESEKNFDDFPVEEVVTRDMLARSLERMPGDTDAVLISFQDHEDTINNWPYLTNEAVQLLVGRGIRLIGLNIPSMDREVDGGRTSNHKIIFQDENRLIVELLALKDAPTGRLMLALNPQPHSTQDAVVCAPTVWPY